MPKIVFIDDDAVGLVAAITALEGAGFTVQRCRRGDTIADTPLLFMIAWDTPHKAASRIVQNIRQNSDVPIIAYSQKLSEVEEVTALRAGADDFVSKHISARVLLARVNAILRRFTGAVDGASITRGPLMLDKQRHYAAWNAQEIPMTVSEFLLLYTLAQRPGFIKTRDQLYDAVYDAQSGADSRAIDSHIKRLRKKMRAIDPDFNAIETLYGIGYRYNEG